MKSIPSGSSQICFVIGDPIAHSLSPALHNFAYSALGLSESFRYTAAHVSAEDLEGALQGMRSLGIRGFSVTLPHKETIIPFLDSLDPLARSLSAVNTVLQEDGKLYGYNTDALGILRPIEKRLGSLKNKKVLIYGAGGAGRTAAIALQNEGASIHIVNRNEGRGRALADEVSGKYFSPEERMSPEFDIIVQASSFGLSEDTSERFVPHELLHPGVIAFESVYSPLRTQFVRDAEEAGATVILGSEMFAEQACAQMLLFTGKSIPVKDAEQFVRDTLKMKEARN